MLDALVCYPLAVLDRLWPRNERHEVALHDVLRVGRVYPYRQQLGVVVGGGEIVLLRRHVAFCSRVGPGEWWGEAP